MPPKTSLDLSPGLAGVSRQNSGKKSLFEILACDPSEMKDSQAFFAAALMMGTSTILQSRNIYASSFKRRTIPGVCRVMAPITEDAVGGRITRRIKSATKAMFSGYLKDFIIVVSKDEEDPHAAIEVYTWSFAYEGGDISASFDSGNSQMAVKFQEDVPLPNQLNNLILRVRSLCRNIMTPLPKGSYATFKLNYSDSTPADYHPNGYRSAPKLYDLDPAARPIVAATLANTSMKVAVLVKSVCIDDEFVAEERLNDLHGPNADDSIMNISIEEASDSRKRKGQKRRAEYAKVNFTFDTSPDATKKMRTAKPAKLDMNDVEPIAGNVAMANKGEKPRSQNTPGRAGKLSEKTPTSSPPKNK